MSNTALANMNTKERSRVIKLKEYKNKLDMPIYDESSEYISKEIPAFLKKYYINYQDGQYTNYEVNRSKVGEKMNESNDLLLSKYIDSLRDNNNHIENSMNVLKTDLINTEAKHHNEIVEMENRLNNEIIKTQEKNYQQLKELQEVNYKRLEEILSGFKEVNNNQIINITKSITEVKSDIKSLSTEVKTNNTASKRFSLTSLITAIAVALSVIGLSFNLISKF